MPELTGQNATLLSRDDTPNRTILDRILLGSVNLSRHTNFTNEEGSDFIDLVVLISRKMLSVWKHLEAYRAEEQRLRETFWANPDQPREHSQELYEEFDVFSVQVKSTLDHLVKVMRPVLGRKWTVYTFDKKGEGVLKALRGCVSANQKAPLQAMESQMFTDVNKNWLALIIEHRDRVNHGQMGGIKIERFSVYRAADGTVHLPIWNNEQTFIEAMDMAWRNLFLYIEDFIALSLNFRIKDQYSFVRREVPLPSPKPTWNVIPRRVADAMLANLPFRQA